jgi:rhodanese-related sulfurtransferase
LNSSEACASERTDVCFTFTPKLKEIPVKLNFKLPLLAVVAATAAIGMTMTYAASNIKEVTVAELKTMVADKGKKVAIFDANGDDFRKSEGTIPGATLLSDYSDYKVSELGTDKTSTLVFYCASTSCPASHAAAEKAVKLGFNQVNVLKVGLQGWKQAGEKVASVK